MILGLKKLAPQIASREANYEQSPPLLVILKSFGEVFHATHSEVV